MNQITAAQLAAKIAADNHSARTAERGELADYILERIPEGYSLSPSDIFWLNHVGTFLKGDMTNENIVKAMKKAIPKDKKEFSRKIEEYSALSDPWELLIDTGICDPYCKPL